MQKNRSLEKLFRFRNLSLKLEFNINGIKNIDGTKIFIVFSIYDSNLFDNINIGLQLKIF